MLQPYYKEWKLFVIIYKCHWFVPLQPYYKEWKPTRLPSYFFEVFLLQPYYKEWKLIGDFVGINWNFGCSLTIRNGNSSDT